MKYRFETVRHNYADLASGSVLYSAPGFPAFPVRLASEIFQRGLAALDQRKDITVWDPCCGSGYLLGVLALLHRHIIDKVIASDLDETAVHLACKNLELLTSTGIHTRAMQLENSFMQFDKLPYRHAAAAARRLAQHLANQGGDVPTRVGIADVFNTAQLETVLNGAKPNLVITDIPYGEQTNWLDEQHIQPVPTMLRTLASILPENAVIVLASRGQKIELGDGVTALSRLKIGTRAIAFIRAGHIKASM